GLTLAEAKTVYQNGWEKLIDERIANLGEKKIKYTYPGLTAFEIELLTNDKRELDKAFQLVIDNIFSVQAANILDLPTDEIINNYSYDESKISFSPLKKENLRK
ncbi:22420_t:CDS:1, partial [Racocetra persica]